MAIHALKPLAIVVAFTVVSGSIAAVHAQEDEQNMPSRAEEPPQIKRDVIIKSDLEGLPGRQMLVWVAEIAPRASSAWHYHPYAEFVYILEGTVVMEVERQAPVIVHAGEIFQAPANTAHRATNVSETTPAKGLVFGLTSAGEPLAVPMKR